MNNINLNIGGGIGAAVGALVGAGIALLLVSPDSPKFAPILGRLAIGGLIVGAIVLNFAWDLVFKKKQ